MEAKRFMRLGVLAWVEMKQWRIQRPEQKP
jgi:hypothetical protein